MKTKIITLFMLFSVSVMAQSTVAPEKVQDAFAEKFSGVEDVSWDKSGSNYTATFMNTNQADVEAVFTKDGIWTETTVFLSEKELLQSIKDELSGKYSSYEFESAMSIENKAGEFYYKIYLFDGEETTIIKYNKEGKKI